jgi:hypothetical protein
MRALALFSIVQERAVGDAVSPAPERALASAGAAQPARERGDSRHNSRVRIRIRRRRIRAQSWG